MRKYILHKLSFCLVLLWLGGSAPPMANLQTDVDLSMAIESGDLVFHQTNSVDGQFVNLLDDKGSFSCRNSLCGC